MAGSPETTEATTEAAPAAPTTRSVACGETITTSTVLRSDVGPCSGDGIVVGADGITLDLNGHRVFGTAERGASAGIRLPGRTGARVLRGTVSGFDAGVVINRGSNNSVRNLIVRDNVGPDDPQNAEFGDGIVLFHSANNDISENQLLRNGIFNGIGVWGLDSNGNTIERNRVEGTVASSDRLFPGAGTGIILNAALELDDPRRGESIANNRILNNVVTNNENSGISNISNVEGRIVGNVVEGNGRCVSTEFGLECNEPSNGIGVQSLFFATPVTRVLVEQNRVLRSAGRGIVVGSQQNRIVRNVALEHETDLVDLNGRLVCSGGGGRGGGCVFQPDCDENVWSANRFRTAHPECAKGELAQRQTATAAPAEASAASAAGGGAAPRPPEVPRRRPPGR